MSAETHSSTNVPALEALASTAAKVTSTPVASSVDVSSGTAQPAPPSPQGSPLDAAHSSKSVDAIASAPETNVMKRPARLLKVLLAMRDEERKEQKLPPFPTPPEANYPVPQYVFVSTRPPPPSAPMSHVDESLEKNLSGRSEPIVREPTPALPKGDVPPLTSSALPHQYHRDHLIHTSAQGGSYPPHSSAASSSSASASEAHYTSIYGHNPIYSTSGVTISGIDTSGSAAAALHSAGVSASAVREVVDLGDRPEKCEKEHELIMRHQLEKKDTRSEAYLISAEWWSKWLKYTQVSSQIELPPPIDNSDLMDGDSLKKGLKLDKDFKELSETQWNALRKWYSGGPAIARARRLLSGVAQPILYPVRVLVTSASSAANLSLETVDLRWTVKQMRDMVSAHMSSPPHRSKLLYQKHNKPSAAAMIPLLDDPITLGELGIEENDVFTTTTGGSDRNADMIELSRQSIPEVRVHGSGSIRPTHDDYAPPPVPANIPSTVSSSGSHFSSVYQDEDTELARVLALSLAEETERQARMKREEDAAKEKAAKNSAAVPSSSSSSSASAAPAATAAAAAASPSIPPPVVPLSVPDYSTPLQPRPISSDYEYRDYGDDSDDERAEFDDSDEDLSYLHSG